MCGRIRIEFDEPFDNVPRALADSHVTLLKYFGRKYWSRLRYLVRVSNLSMTLVE